MWMSSNKRGSQEEGNDERNLQVPSKRRFGHSDQQSNTCSSAGPSLANDVALSLEPLIRKMLQEMIPPMMKEMIPPMMEEVLPPILQRCLSPCCCTCGLSLNRQIGKPGGRGRALQLCFINNLPSKFFTLSSKITAEDGSQLQIAVCDANLIVQEDISLVKVQLCVLKGDFGSDGSDDWTAEEFNANIMSQRDGKPPLLGGDTVVTLKNGIGSITQSIVFTDNSSWTRSKRFRIGVKVIQSNSIGAEIKETRSQPIRVRDNRGLAYKKHDRPTLSDEVWRLQKIAKNGPIHMQLSSYGIETVKDLLQLYTTNQASLREKIGNIASKKWDTIIEHAKACEIDDDKRYMYQYSPAGHQSISLVFNCIYEVVEVFFNGKSCRSLESLNLKEKSLVERVKRQVYNNLKDLKSPEPTLAVYGAPYQGGLQQYNILNAHQALPMECVQTWPNLSQPSTSTSLIDEATQSDQVGSSQLSDQLVDMPLDWLPEEGHLVPAAADIGDNGWPISEPQINEIGSLFTHPILLEQQKLFHLPYDYGVEYSNQLSFPNSAVYISSKGSHSTVWNKIRNAVKLVMMHAAKRKSKFYHYQY